MPSVDWTPPNTAGGASSWQNQPTPASTRYFPSPKRSAGPALPLDDNDDDEEDDEDLDRLYSPQSPKKSPEDDPDKSDDDAEFDDDRIEHDDNDKDPSFYSTDIASTPSAAALMYLTEPLERYERIYNVDSDNLNRTGDAQACWSPPARHGQHGQATITFPHTSEHTFLFPWLPAEARDTAEELDDDIPCYVTVHDPDESDNRVELYIAAGLAKWYSSESEGNIGNLVASSKMKDGDWLVVRLQECLNAKTKSKTVQVTGVIKREFDNLTTEEIVEHTNMVNQAKLEELKR